MPKSTGDNTKKGALFLDKKDASAAAASLGERIARARDAQGLSAAQLARRIGVKSDTLHGWEAGRSGPRPNVLLRLAGMLNASPTWLLTGTGESPAEPASETEMMHIRATVERLRGALLGIAAELKQLEERLDSYESFHD